MRAWILSIGNELLIGRTVNTNAAWLARKLTLLGYDVRREVTVPDEEDEEAEAFRDAVRRGVELVVSTGGLGPTFDDKTSESLAKALGRQYDLNDAALELVKRRFAAAGLELTQPRLKQAMMPRGAEPIPNPVGTAPGIWVREGSSIIIAMPGVPAEMQGMFEQYVEPRLREVGPRLSFAEESFTVRGVPEADAAPIIERGMRMGRRVYVKSHPKGHEVGAPYLEIHVYASAESEGEAREEVARVAGYLREELRKAGGEVE
ncbi:competence damage-inducible protein A [Thermocladium modestius]|uniref:Competence damage-inducible protein A n=1 Tax=Thermocladium modestius TaxID=62609 RepID=A0A830GZ90_9CREN|nr:nicotinamide mononucleotide deamidase-related protein [Thermocladium modestius]GGP22149.1 competence damage-inducible protein A [Thermocladium modestius]